MLFKLLAQHYIDDRLLEEGELVGDGQTVSFKLPDGSYRTPTYQMEGLDDEAKKAILALDPMPSIDAALAALPNEPAGVDNATKARVTVTTGGGK